MIPVAGILACLILFLNSYYHQFKINGSDAYFPGLGEAIEYVEDADAQSVYISDYVNQPYIFALFYSRMSPYEFIDTVDYINPDGAFRMYIFWEIPFWSIVRASGEYIIWHWSESDWYDVIGRFGNYIVCKGSM